MNAEKTGLLIKELRTQKNMTQAQLAEKLGVSKVTVSRYENGNDNFSLKKLCEICAALDCDVSAVFRPAIAKSKATE